MKHIVIPNTPVPPVIAEPKSASIKEPINKPKNIFRRSSIENICGEFNPSSYPLSSETDGDPLSSCKKKGVAFKFKDNLQPNGASMTKELLSQSSIRTFDLRMSNNAVFINSLNHAIQNFDTKKEAGKDLTSKLAKQRTSLLESEGSYITEDENEEEQVFDKSEYLRLRQDSEKFKRDLEEISEKYNKIRKEHRKLANENASLHARKEMNEATGAQSENRITVLEVALKDSARKLDSYVDHISLERNEKENINLAFNRMFEKVKKKRILDQAALTNITAPMAQKLLPPAIGSSSSTRSLGVKRKSKKVITSIGRKSNINMDEDTFSYMKQLEAEGRQKDIDIINLTSELRICRGDQKKMLVSGSEKLLKMKKEIVRQATKGNLRNQDSLDSSRKYDTLKVGNSRPRSPPSTQPNTAYNTVNEEAIKTNTNFRLKELNSDIIITKKLKVTKFQYKEARPD